MVCKMLPSLGHLDQLQSLSQVSPAIGFLSCVMAVQDLAPYKQQVLGAWTDLSLKSPVMLLGQSSVQPGNASRHAQGLGSASSIIRSKEKKKAKEKLD